MMIFLLLVIQICAWYGDTWVRSFGSPSEDFISAISLPLNDSFYVVGVTDTSGPNRNSVIVKFHPNGTLDWGRRMSVAGGYLRVLRMSVTTDDALLICCTINISPQSAALIKLDRHSGTTLWIRYVDHYNTNLGVSAFESNHPDGRIYFSMALITSYHYDMFVFALNPDGSTIWGRSIPHEGQEHFTDLIPTQSGGFLTSGYIVSGDYRLTTETDSCVIKWTAEGEIAHTFVAGNGMDYYLFRLLELSDGEHYIAVGSTVGASGFNMIKLDKNLTVEWAVWYNTAALKDILELDNGNFLILGTVSSGYGNMFLFFANGTNGETIGVSTQFEYSHNGGRYHAFGKYLQNDSDSSSIRVVAAFSSRDDMGMEYVEVLSFGLADNNLDLPDFCYTKAWDMGKYYSDTTATLLTSNSVVMNTANITNDVEVKDGVGIINITSFDIEKYAHNFTECWECFSQPRSYPSVCSGEGTCVSNDTCDCSETNGQYSGPECEIWSCFGVPKNLEDEVCYEGNGQCYSLDHCVCGTGYSSFRGEKGPCDKWYCGGYLLNLTEKVCNNRGSCISPDLCTCDEGYYGGLCESYKCDFDKDEIDKVCSGNGVCTEPGNCACSTGFVGKYCGTNVIMVGVLAPVGTIAGIIAVLVASFLLMSVIICLVLFCCFALGLFLATVVLVAIVTFQKRRMTQFGKLKNFDILLAEQEMEEDENTASLNINKKLFMVDFDEIKIDKILGEGGSNSVVYLSVPRKMAL